MLSLREPYARTLLLSTHNPEVAACCDRVVRLSDGRITHDERLVPPDGATMLDRLGRLGF